MWPHSIAGKGGATKCESVPCDVLCACACALHMQTSLREVREKGLASGNTDAWWVACRIVRDAFVGVSACVRACGDGTV
jgi:hypothetical protein